MRKIFVDAGAHFGESSRRFHRKHPDYLIHAFEPNPHIEVSLPNGAILHKEAVWIEDCERDFYFHPTDKTSEACTLMPSKINITREGPARVRCINFSKWLMDNFCEEDYIILKMDIEGAEYAVLEKMMADGSINMINALYPEFHCKKVGVRKKVRNVMVKRLLSIKTLKLRTEMARSKI